MADLKSVENSAWHQLNVDITANNYHTTGTVLYRAVSSSTIQAMAVVTSVSIDPYGNVAGNIPLFQLPKYSSINVKDASAEYVDSSDIRAIVTSGNTVYELGRDYSSGGGTTYIFSGDSEPHGVAEFYVS